MRKLNLPLIAGGIIIILIILVMIFPGSLTHVNPNGVQTVKALSQSNGSFTLQGAPFPPSKDSPLGTDQMGRDILSLIIYGTRLTLSICLMVVAGRFLIAVPVGILAGMKGGFSKGLINQFSTVFTALPAILTSIIILSMGYFLNLNRQDSIIAFVVVLTFVGWSKLALLIMERVENIMARPFIKSEIAIGKSRFKTALENIMPHLLSELIVLFFMEMAGALVILMGLGVFGVFVGNIRFIANTDGGVVIPMNISFQPEWASMLASSRDYIRTAPWMPLYPALAFFISIMGFNLFGEGLRKILQERDSRFVYNIRKLLSFGTIKASIVNSGRRGGKITAAVVTVLVITLICSSLVHVTGFNYASAQAAVASNFGGEVVTGNESAGQTASEIADAMKTMGYIPLSKNGFINQYKTPGIYNSKSSSVEFTGRNGAITKLSPGRDYSVGSFENISFSGKIRNTIGEDLFSIDDFAKFNKKVVLIDTSLYSKDAVDSFIKEIGEKSTVLGFLCIIPENEALPPSMGEQIYNKPVIWITAKASKLLADNSESDVSIAMEYQALDNTGRNIIGMIPGNDSRSGKNAIIIGFGYNYKSEDRAVGIKRILFGLEAAKKLAEEKGVRYRTIIVAFWDGTLNDDYNGIRYYCRDPIYPMDESDVYIDLTRLDTDTSGNIYLNLSQAPPTRYFAWNISQQFEENLKTRGVNIKNYNGVRSLQDIAETGPDTDEMMYYKLAIPTVIVQMKSDKSGGNFTLNDLGNVLINTIDKNNH